MKQKGQAMAEYKVLIAGFLTLLLVAALVGCGPNIEDFAKDSVCPILVSYGNAPSYCCDQGRGNGDDGCSPGNSDHRHDPNDPQSGNRK